MKGTYEIRIENRRMQYKFRIKRNITVIRGDSATGKTTLVDMLQEYNDNGPESGIILQCDRDCIVLSGRFWKQDLAQISNSIVFIDEGNRFVVSEEFARLIQGTDNYYVLITRERIENIPYSVKEIYGIRTSGKFGTLQKAYHEMYRIYPDTAILPERQPDQVITEDSNSGYQFFQSICENININCVSANGKSNIFSYLARHHSESMLVIADGAAFGPEIGKIAELLKYHKNIYVYLPESFEWMLLSSGIFEQKRLKEILANPADFIECHDYFSWEQYFTSLLITYSQHTIWAYAKKRLNPLYLHEGNRNRILAVSPFISHWLKGDD